MTMLREQFRERGRHRTSSNPSFCRRREGFGFIPGVFFGWKSQPGGSDPQVGPRRGTRGGLLVLRGLNRSEGEGKVLDGAWENLE